MVFYLCNLTLHDNVFFATREMGTLYETEKYLHNWALSFALFEATYIPKPYRLQGALAQRPGYLEAENEQNLLTLNEVGIYVFPALPLQWSYQVNTFKAAQVTYYGKSKQFGDKGADRNYPINYGRAKELAVGSIYRTYVMAKDVAALPSWMQEQEDNHRQTWIRLGKWAAKIRVSAKLIPESGIRQTSGEYTCDHPLNPIDLPNSTRLLLYNRIVMPPVSLVSQARLSGTYWDISKPDDWSALPDGSYLNDLPNRVCLPGGVAYGASTAVAVS
ncbi:MAG: type I-D CRISPR-associated protein Cas5/Csc1 [Leptolyngbyaceae cyanobacterium RM2_2_4]|nr:type I-D CRISPR-associated protein Cas5/Csc1 [Leptolyngbyaceae cyanobacterium SM1_4_3]NJO50444.1 type I-D CRISPR-associated protein Cas5/Csc1 [Leptolyngbyaceae cyanobacterium RM2_2_4]